MSARCLDQLQRAWGEGVVDMSSAGQHTWRYAGLPIFQMFTCLSSPPVATRVWVCRRRRSGGGNSDTVRG
jgi:hypothetical protein